MIRKASDSSVGWGTLARSHPSNTQLHKHSTTGLCCFDALACGALPMTVSRRVWGPGHRSVQRHWLHRIQRGLLVLIRRGWSVGCSLFLSACCLQFLDPPRWSDSATFQPFWPFRHTFEGGALTLQTRARLLPALKVAHGRSKRKRLPRGSTHTSLSRGSTHTPLPRMPATTRARLLPAGHNTAGT
jgi:hypothetical protein